MSLRHALLLASRVVNPTVATAQTAFTPPEPPPRELATSHTSKRHAVAQHAMVAAAHPLGVEAGSALPNANAAPQSPNSPMASRRSAVRVTEFASVLHGIMRTLQNGRLVWQGDADSRRDGIAIGS